MGLAVSLIGFAACASSGGPRIVPAAELSHGGGEPAIASIADRGGGDIPGSGQLPPVAGDGVAVIGEVLYIAGRNFGRQPTVTIGGTAAAVVSRSEDGGILLRVAPGTPAGQQPLVVTTDEGRAQRLVSIRRLAMGRVGPRVFWFGLAPAAPTLVGETTVPGARAIAGSRDGRAGYVVDGAGALLTFELPAQKIPVLRGRLPLAGPVRTLLAPGFAAGLTAGPAPRLVAIGADALTEIDTTMPLAPVVTATRPLPPWARGGKALIAALSPDGKQLAVALPERNRVVLVDIAALKVDHEPATAELALAPEVLAPVLVDLAFAPDGRTLWALSGATTENQLVGPQSTRVHAIRITPAATAGAPPTLARARLVQIDAATSPQAIVTGHGLGLQSGAAIRLPPERATVYIAAYHRDQPRPQLFAVGADDVATPAAILAPVGVIGRPQVSPDEAWLLALTNDPEGVNLLLAIPLAGGKRPVVLSLPGKSLERALAEAPLSSRASEVKIQP